ncbi:coiled-coil domain-containing protein 60 [Lepisosteus oculatus]|uniref:coiled-coil domain-containing protein 60 n=1 Tax=Lepisosteus oculatus TaxID=7918 RepID=UPI0035F50FDD
MPVCSSKSLDPRNFVIIKPLPISPPAGIKLQARSSTVFNPCEPNREQVFRENYRRRQKQLTRQGYRAVNWRPYEEIGEPLVLEPKRLILHSLGQPEQICKDEPSGGPKEDQESAFNKAQLDSAEESKNVPSRVLPIEKTGDDGRALRRHLTHTRCLVSAVKQGQGYFHILQKEAQDLQKAHLEEQQRLAELRRSACKPPSFSTEEGSESDETTEGFFRTALPAEHSQLYKKHARRASPARPFTPLHCSLTSPQPSEASQETIFRQLCCLNWLLEALTLEPLGRMGPVFSCWDIKDPGRSKTMIKTLNKEKAIEIKWDQFITQSKSKKPPSRVLRKLSVKPRKTSFLGSSCLSEVSSAVTPTMGSTSSLAPGSEDLVLISGGVGHAEESESATKASVAQSRQDSEDKEPVSDYLQKLLDAVHQSVAKELHNSEQHSGNPNDSLSQAKEIPGRDEQKESGPETHSQRPKSSPIRQLSATSQFITSKSSMASEMRARILERAEEVAMSLNDHLEAKAKRRWVNSVHTFLSLAHVSNGRRDLHRIGTPAEEKDIVEKEEKPTHCTWLSELLSSLPEGVLENRKICRILEKLANFADGPSLRIRPNQFLRVLGSLRTWELCSPDVSVAVEIVRKHIVHMSEEDYEAWLCPRVKVPPRAQSAPPSSEVNPLFRRNSHISSIFPRPVNLSL